MRALFLLVAAACTAPAPVVSRERMAALKEVEEPAVANCKALGRFVGVSASPGETGMAQAREAARARAVAAGATHYVAADEWQTPDAVSFAVKAYLCP